MREHRTKPTGPDQTITKIEMVEVPECSYRSSNELRIWLGRRRGVALYDDGGQCLCEARYLTCDDDLSAFVGATYLGWELRGGLVNAATRGEDAHEEQWLIVKTSLGEFTVCSHNEHNGYYSGIDVAERLL